MNKTEKTSINNSIIFTSDALNITFDRDRRDLEYNLHVPLMVFKNMNKIIGGKINYDGYIYAPSGTSFPTPQSLNATELQIYMRHPDYFEFMFLLDGECEEKINEKINTYRPGYCRIAYKNTRHLERFDKDFSAIYFCFSSEMVNRMRAYDTFFFWDGETEMLDPVLAGFLGISVGRSESRIADYLVFTPQGDRVRLLDSIESIANDFKAGYENQHYGSTFYVNSLFGKLLTMLSDNKLYNIEHVQLSTSSDAVLFNQISSILLESKGQISRSQLEDLLNYSGSYISRVVRKYSGKTLFDYSMTYCMDEAAHRLRQTCKSISDIASDLGFSNRTHFYKQFRKTYHVTPNEFRKMHKYPGLTFQHDAAIN